MTKRVIIIDNEDQSEIIIKLKRNGKSKGIDLEIEQFNVGSTFDNDLLSEGAIDINKVVLEYKKRFKGQTFHLAAFDWDLSDDKIEGVELMRMFEHHRILRNTPKLLYSGLLEDKLGSKLDDFRRGQISRKQLMNDIKVLINADIKGFVSRENYEVEILTLLEKIEETLDLNIENVLNKHPKLIFSNRFTNQNFNGKTFQEIANMLEENNQMKDEFKKEIIEQVISYLTEKI